MSDRYPYVVGIDRDDGLMMTLNMLVGEYDTPRLVENFVDCKVRDRIKLKYSERENRGRKSYDPYMMLTLFIVGIMKGIRTCRKLEEFAQNHTWGIWICSRLNPNFRTINDFRKNNAAEIAAVFYAFNEFLKEDVSEATGIQAFGGNLSVDGTKIRAQQSKDGCHTANKIGDRIQNDKNRIAELTAELEDSSWEEGCDESELTEELKAKADSLKKYKERLKKHEDIQDSIRESGEQYSENDPDARLMKNHYGGCNPSYNMQTAVDTESHLIAAVNTTNKCTDHGLIKPTIDNVPREDGEIIEVIADNGYAQPEDMVNSLENGIIPNTFLSKYEDANGNRVHNKEIELEFKYEDNKVTDDEKASTKADDLKKCLRSGVVPEPYKDYLEPVTDGNGKVKVFKRTSKEIEATLPFGLDKMTEEEMKEKAKEGYFIRDPKKNEVYCPGGKVLRKKSDKGGGTIRYVNKLACSKCPFRDKCFNSTKTTKWKEIDFSKSCRIKKANFRSDGKEEAITPIPKVKKTVKSVTKWEEVHFIFRPDQNKLDKRKCTSEHPFGTMKRIMHGDFFLLKGLKMVTVEANLLALGYNITRALNIFSAQTLMKVMER